MNMLPTDFTFWGQASVSPTPSSIKEVITRAIWSFVIDIAALCTAARSVYMPWAILIWVCSSSFGRVCSHL